MKTVAVLRTGCAVSLICLLAGCAFTGLRREPDKLAPHRYEASGMPTLARGLAMTVDVSDCVETAMVGDHGVFGGNSFSGTIPLKKIVQREFEQMVGDVFRAPAEGEREQVMVKVYSKSVVLRQRMSTSSCEIAFDVQMVDPMNEGIKPYYRGSFTRTCSCRHKDDEVVPQSVYDAIVGVVEDFVKGAAQDRNAVRRLSAIPHSDARTRKPELQNIRFGVVTNDCMTGECTVACNDWDGFDGDRWARRNIREQCHTKMGIDGSRLRLVFMKDEFTRETKVWHYAFMAFARNDLVMNYNPETRQGICIGDLDMLKTTAEEAASRMEAYVCRRLGVRRGRSPAGAGIRCAGARGRGDGGLPAHRPEFLQGAGYRHSGQAQQELTHRVGRVRRGARGRGAGSARCPGEE